MFLFKFLFNGNAKSYIALQHLNIRNNIRTFSNVLSEQSRTFFGEERSVLRENLNPMFPRTLGGHWTVHIVISLKII